MKVSKINIMRTNRNTLNSIIGSNDAKVEQCNYLPPNDALRQWMKRQYLDYPTKEQVALQIMHCQVSNDIFIGIVKTLTNKYTAVSN